MAPKILKQQNVCDNNAAQQKYSYRTNLINTNLSDRNFDFRCGYGKSRSTSSQLYSKSRRAFQPARTEAGTDLPIVRTWPGPRTLVLLARCPSHFLSQTVPKESVEWSDAGNLFVGKDLNEDAVSNTLGMAGRRTFMMWRLTSEISIGDASRC